MTQALFPHLEQLDPAAVGKRLEAHALFVARAKGWPSADRDTALLEGVSPADLVAETLNKIFAGDTDWDSDRPLLPYAKVMILNRIRDLARRRRQRREVSLDATGGGHLAVSEGIDARVERLSQLEADDDLMMAIWEKVSDRPDLKRIVEVVLDGVEPKPRFLAERLECSVQEVNNSLKRLRRLGRKMR